MDQVRAHSIAELKLMQAAVVREQANDGLLRLSIACTAAASGWSAEGGRAVDNLRRALEKQRDGR